MTFYALRRSLDLPIRQDPLKGLPRNMIGLRFFFFRNDSSNKVQDYFRTKWEAEVSWL